MSLLFVHDHKFRRINQRLYSTGGLSNEVLERYTNIFGETTVIARVLEEEQASSKYSEITNQNVTIKNALECNSFEIEKITKESEAIIIRMPSFLGLKVQKIAKKIGKPYLIELVACPWDSLWNHSIQGKIVAPYMTLMTKRLVYNAPYVLYVTNSFLQRRYPTKGKQISCSDVVLYEIDEKILFNRQLKIKGSNNKIIIGTIAAVDVKFKGQKFVIEALGKLKKEGKQNFEYHLVGNGDKSFLKKIIHKNNLEEEVKFLGGIPHSQIFEWLDSIDIYIQPSQQEGLPRALVEAMSRGVPAIGANVGGIPELIDKKYIFEHGFRCKKNICELLLNLDEAAMLAQSKANFNVSNNFRRDVLESRRVRFYEGFLNDYR